MSVRFWSLFFYIMCSFVIVMAHPTELYGVQDSQDSSSLLLVTRLTFPNGCYEGTASRARVNQQARQIWLSHWSRQHAGMCTMALVNKLFFTRIARPEKGVYEVFDANSRNYLGLINVEDRSVQIERANIK